MFFNVYSDNKIGFNRSPIPSMPLEVDEDCDTTESIQKRGALFCIKDLKDVLKVAVNRSETDSSYATLEDC